MNRTSARAILAAGFWCVLAAWQSARAFSRCEASSGWAAVFWVLLVLALAAPILALARRARPGNGRPGMLDDAWVVAVLAYLPLLVAMRLLELCVPSR